MQFLILDQLLVSSVYRTVSLVATLAGRLQASESVRKVSGLVPFRQALVL